MPWNLASHQNAPALACAHGHTPAEQRWVQGARKRGLLPARGDDVTTETTLIRVRRDVVAPRPGPLADALLGSTTLDGVPPGVRDVLVMS
jgi:hypothetical protein